MSDIYKDGFRNGVVNALALIRSHFEKLPGFDSAAFDKDIEDIISRVGGEAGISPDYSDGFEASFSGLKDTNIRKTWTLDHD